MVFPVSGKLHPLTLKFRNPELEQAFLDDYQRKLTRLTRYILAFAVVYMLSFSFFDLVRIPDKFEQMLVLRLISGVVLACALVSTWSPLFDRWNQHLLVATAWVTMIMIILMFNIMTPHESYRYYTAVGQVILFVHILLGVRTVYSVISTIVILLGYSYYVAEIKSLNSHMLADIHSYLIGIAFVATIGGYALERYKRNAFYQLLLTGHFRDVAEQATAAKSRFLSSMSHELRTPLNAILGYTELIQDEINEKEKWEIMQDLDKVHLASEHLLGLINNILDIAKIESGKIVLNRLPVKLPDLLQQVEITIRPLADRNHNTFQIQTGKLPEVIHTDAIRLSQILINLLGNACKFTEHGAIILSVESTDETLVFTVSDTGIGMSQETIDGLFEDFQQCTHPSPGSYRGTGLGLSISRQLCELMGGRILVSSELEKGSTFVLELPCKPVTEDR